VLAARGLVRCELQGESGLADTAGTGERHHPVRGNEVGELREVVVAPDEARALRERWGTRTCRCGRRLGGRERCVVVDDALLELDHARRWVEADLLTEESTEFIGAAQRVRLAPRSVQREHELSPEALAQGMLDDEPLELTDHGAVIAERQAR